MSQKPIIVASHRFLQSLAKLRYRSAQILEIVSRCEPTQQALLEMILTSEDDGVNQLLHLVEIEDFVTYCQIWAAITGEVARDLMPLTKL